MAINKLGSRGGFGSLGGLGRAGTSIPFMQNLTAATTTKLLAGYQAMLAGTRNMNLAIMGDSTDRGVDETASPYNSQYRLSLAEQLAILFRSDGIASGANNWYGISGTNFNDYMIRDSRVSATGSATAFGTAVPIQGGAELEFPTAAGTFNFAPQQNCTKAEIYYQDSSAGRAFTWAVDGGSMTTITTTGLNTIVKLTISLGSLGAHTVQLAWSAGFVRIYGIDCYDDTRKEVTIRQWAISGGTTSDMILDTGTPSSGRLRQLSLFPVDCVFGDVGLVNSWRNSRSVANCTTDINTLIDAVHAGGADFIFCIPPFDTGSTGATASQQQYIDAAISACLAKGCAIFNVRQAWVSKSASDASGFTSAADAVHPTILGQANRATLLKPAFRYGMGLWTNASIGPAAPVLSMDATWDSSQASPLFDIDAAFADQDDIQFEIQTAGAGWASPTVVHHTVTTAEITGGQISLGIGALANGDWEVRCKFKHFGGVYSSYSNVQAFTIAAAASSSFGALLPLLAA